MGPLLCPWRRERKQPVSLYMAGAARKSLFCAPIMKWTSVFSAALLASCAAAWPAARPKSPALDLEPYFESPESLLELRDFDFHALLKRDDTSLLITLAILAFNKSGLLWTVLDQVADSPSTISYVANLSASAALLLLPKLGDISLSLILGIAQAGSNSTLVKSLKDSGLLTSVLDGVLLDDSYRPVLVNLTYRVVEGIKPELLYVFNDVLRAELKKRDSAYSGSLQSFVGNALSSVLNLPAVGAISGDLFNALNDTGVAVYTVKRAIADESYQDMVFELVLDVVNSGKVNIDLSSINVTSLLAPILADPSSITDLAKQLLSGSGSSSSSGSGLGINLGKYELALRGIVNGLESKGLFADLNSYIFSSSATATQEATSTTAPSRARSTAKAITTSTPAGKKEATAAPKSTNSANAASPKASALMWAPSALFGALLLL